MSDATNGPQPRVRYELLVSAVLVFSCCGCPTHWLVVEPWWRDVEVKRLRADIDANLPDGSSREQAETWLNAHGMTEWGVTYCYITRAPKDGEGKSVPCGFWGKIPKTNCLGGYAEIYIVIYFDDNDRVQKRSVSYWEPSF